MTTAGWHDEGWRYRTRPAPCGDDGSLRASIRNLNHYQAVADVMGKHADIAAARQAHRRARTVVIELGIVAVLLVIGMVIFALPVLALPVLPLVGVAFLIGYRIDITADRGVDLDLELTRLTERLIELSRGNAA